MYIPSPRTFLCSARSGCLSFVSLVGHACIIPRQQKLFTGGRVGKSRILCSTAIVPAPKLCTPHRSTAGINCNNGNCTALHAHVRDGCTAKPSRTATPDTSISYAHNSHLDTRTRAPRRARAGRNPNAQPTPVRPDPASSRTSLSYMH